MLDYPEMKRIAGHRGTSRYDPIDIAIGRNLEVLRLSEKLTAEGLGAMVGVTFQQIRKYERAENRISASVLVKIARSLGCSISALFMGVHVGMERAAEIEGVEAMYIAQAISDPDQKAAWLALGRTLATKTNKADRS